MRKNGLQNIFLFLGFFLCFKVQPAFASTFQFFEDDESFILKNRVGKEWTDFSGNVMLDKDDYYTGKASLRVTPNQVLVGKGFVIPVRKDPKEGEYRYLTMAWKKKGGKYLILQLHWRDQEGKDRHFNYRAGAEAWVPNRALAQSPPSEWAAYEGENCLDLFQDIGQEVEITAVIFSTLDGEYALFDHLYFTSTIEEAKALVEPLPALRSRLQKVQTELNLAAERLDSFDQEAKEVVAAQKRMSEIAKEVKILITRFTVSDGSFSETELASASAQVSTYERELREKIIPLAGKNPWELE